MNTWASQEKSAISLQVAEVRTTLEGDARKLAIEIATQVLRRPVKG